MSYVMQFISPRACECECASHFSKDETPPKAHEYGAKFPTLERIETAYGRMIVCHNCAHYCHNAI